MQDPEEFLGDDYILENLNSMFSEILEGTRSHGFFFALFRNDEDPLFSGGCAEDVEIGTASQFADVFTAAEKAVGREAGGAYGFLEAVNLAPPSDVKH